MSPQTTRRAFLQSAALLAAPYFIPNAALGHGLRTRAGAIRRAPSDRLTIGMIGVGNMGGGHLHSLLEDAEVQVVAICDVDQAKRDAALAKVLQRYGDEQRAGTWHGCELYHEFERLLDRPDLDAVVIAVPDHWHAQVAVAACRAGKDVYCEKPLSLTIREARAMVNAARRCARVVQTGSQQRSDGRFRLACELVRSGRIGRLHTVYVGVGGPSRERYLPEEPLRPGLDWDRWLGPACWQPYNAERCSGSYSGGWRHIRDYSGGMMTDWGAHHFDIAQWGMGMDETGPIEINAPASGHARGISNPGPHEPPPPEEQTLVYRYANGVRMIHGGANGVKFVGSDGAVEVNRGYLRTWPAALLREPLGPRDVHLYESPGHMTDWLNCIRTRGRPICDVEIGCRSATVCHLGNIAYWLRRSLRWDPASEQIVGDGAAARWLDRPRRAPWFLET